MFRFEEPAYLYLLLLLPLLAAVGLVQFARYPKLLARRKEIIERYNKGLAKLPAEALTHFDDMVTSSGHLYLVRLTGKGEEYRNDMITRMAENGVACNVHFKPLPMHTDRKSTRLNSSHTDSSRMPSSA